MKILIAAILVICLGGIIAFSFSMDETTLTAEERELAVGACIRCHGENPHDDDDFHSREVAHIKDCTACHDDVHQVHANAECMKCHIGTSGLETADNAHDALEWVGIGVAAATVAGLALNFTVARRRLANPEDENADTND